MPEEAHTFNQIPESPSTGPNNNYPQASSSQKDDSFSGASQVNSSNTPNSAPPPSSPPPPLHTINPSAHHAQTQTFSEFNQSTGASLVPSVLIWLSLIITLVATGFFWLSDYSNVKAISEKENEKNSIVSQLNSESNKKIEQEALSFQNAFSELSSLVANQVSKASFLTELYTHITKDVKITSIALSAEGELGIDGATGSYRQVADLMLGLKGYSKLSDISLKSVSVSIEEEVPTNEKITFSIDSMADLGNGAKAESSATGDTTSSESTTSGSASTSTSTGSNTTPTPEGAGTTTP